MKLDIKLALDAAEYLAALEKARAALAELSDNVERNPGAAKSATSAAAALDGLKASMDALAQSSTVEAETMQHSADGLSDVADSGTQAAAALTAVGAASASTGQAMRSSTQATDNAVQALAAAQAVSGLLSGTLSGTASGVIALTGALKSLNVAAAGPISLFVGLAAAVVALGKACIDSKDKAAQLGDAIRFDNAESGIENMRRAYERFQNTLQGTINLARELRAITAEGDDLDFQRKLAENELARKQELAGLDAPTDESIKAVNTKYQRQAQEIEADRAAYGVGAGASDVAARIAENEKQLASKRAEQEELMAAAEEAVRYSSEASTRAKELRSQNRLEGAQYGAIGVGVKSYERMKGLETADQQAERWSGKAKDLVKEADTIREEVEELERKNKALSEQTRLYEKRNALVELQRAAAAIPEVEAVRKDTEEKAKGSKGSGLSVDTDRLARIGGFTSGMGGNRLESINEKQLSEATKTRQAVEKMAQRKTTATWGNA